MTVDTFGDFELSFQWKVAPGANSGVKYNVSEEFSLKHTRRTTRRSASSTRCSTIP